MFIALANSFYPRNYRMVCFFSNATRNAFVVFVVLLVFSARAQDTKRLELSFLALANVATPHTGTDSNHKPMLMGYEDFTAQWRPWLHKNKPHVFVGRILATQGPEPSADMVGDLQVFSNIEAGNYIGLFELYYLHHFNNRHSLLLGQSDLCSNFMSLDGALWFSNSSFGVLPTLSVNRSVPIFPIASPSVVYNYRADKLRVSLGLFDGDVGDTETNKYNLQPRLSKSEGAFLISEAEYRYGESEFDNLIASVYMHTVTQQGTQTSRNYKPTGYYLMGQHGFGDGGEGLPKLQTFVQIGHCTETAALVTSHGSMGMVVHNLSSKLEADCLGMAVTHAHIHKRLQGTAPLNKKGETAFEIFFETQLVRGLFFHPSLNYLVNPGASSVNGNALVSCIYVRLEL